MDDVPTASPPSAPDLDLAARRREMEREFVEKHRDLKAQDKRRRESLEQEKQEFESYRRQKVKELADREEKLRRTTENKETQVKVTAASLEELEALRRQVREHDAAEWRRRKEMAEKDARAAAAESALRRSKALAGWLTALAVLAPVAWLASGWPAGGLAAGLAGGLAAAALLLRWLYRGTFNVPQSPQDR